MSPIHNVLFIPHCFKLAETIIVNIHQIYTFKSEPLTIITVYNCMLLRTRKARKENEESLLFLQYLFRFNPESKIVNKISVGSQATKFITSFSFQLMLWIYIKTRTVENRTWVSQESSNTYIVYLTWVSQKTLYKKYCFKRALKTDSKTTKL